MLLLSARLSEESQLFIKWIAEHYITNQKDNLEQAGEISLGIPAPCKSLKCHSDQVTYSNEETLLRTAEIMTLKLNTR